MIIANLDYEMTVTSVPDQAICGGGYRRPYAAAYSTSAADAIGGTYSLTAVNTFTSTVTSVYGATSFSGAGATSISAG